MTHIKLISPLAESKNRSKHFVTSKGFSVLKIFECMYGIIKWLRQRYLVITGYYRILLLPSKCEIIFVIIMLIFPILR